MRIVYLPSTRPDLLWFRQYYQVVFTEGDAQARVHFHAMQRLLISNPYIGRKVDGQQNVRELQIARTPFSVIYRVTTNQIEVLRVWDSRQSSF